MATAAFEHSNIAQIILLRILCNGLSGCTKAELRADLQALVSHRFSKGEWRQNLDKTLTTLVLKKSLETTPRGRLKVTHQGQKEALYFIGAPKLPTRNWKDLQSIFLTAKSLNIKSRVLRTLKPLKTADGLRAAIIKTYYDLPIKSEIPTVTQIRNALAVNTINETFDIPQKKQAKANSRVPEKLALFLASQKLRRPRSIETSNQLLSFLAAEAVGSVQPDAKALRLQLLRQLMIPKDANDANISNISAPKSSMRPTYTNTNYKKAQQTQSEMCLAIKPDAEAGLDLIDLKSFSNIVLEFAKPHATGWQGNKRAFVSHVWNSMRAEKQNLSLNIDKNQFKTMLADAHRAGHLMLGIADLRDKENMTDIQESAIRYKNTEWHYIRMKD